MSSFFDEFEPLKFTPQQEAVMEIQDEMRRVMNDLALVYAQSCHGFALLAAHLEAERESLLAQLSEMMPRAEAEGVFAHVSQLLTENRPPERVAAAPAVGTLQDLHARNLPEGANIAALGAFCLIALYQYWEDSWRPHLAKALGRLLKDIGSDLWGDVRLIRICLIHKRGVADADLPAKAKELLWFSEGDPIVIDPPKFIELMARARAFMERLPLLYEPAAPVPEQPASPPD
jgi:hypothetical protein